MTRDSKLVFLNIQNNLKVSRAMGNQVLGGLAGHLTQSFSHLPWVLPFFMHVGFLILYTTCQCLATRCLWPWVIIKGCISTFSWWKVFKNLKEAIRVYFIRGNILVSQNTAWSNWYLHLWALLVRWLRNEWHGSGIFQTAHFLNLGSLLCVKLLLQMSTRQYS